MRAWLLLGIIVLGGTGLIAQDRTRADASSMQTKVLAIVERGLVQPARRARPLATTFTDQEANAYFKVYGPELFPSGVKDAAVSIEDAGRVQARAMVALDQALKSKERSWLDPLAWVTGSLEVAAAGTLTATDGRGQFVLDRASLGGVAIPKSLLQQLVTFYSSSPAHPDGFNLDEPFDLPAGIQSVRTTRGRATVVQP